MLNVGTIPHKQASSSSDLKGRNIVIETSLKSTKEGRITRRATVSTKPLSSAGLVSRASQKKKQSEGDIGVSMKETDQVQEGLRRNRQYSKSVVAKSIWEETGQADSQTKAKWPTGVEGGVGGRKTTMDTASNRTGTVQASGGSQTFQVPLRKVPSNQAPVVKGDNADETKEPAWVAVARVSPFPIVHFVHYRCV